MSLKRPASKRMLCSALSFWLKCLPLSQAPSYLIWSTWSQRATWWRLAMKWLTKWVPLCQFSESSWSKQESSILRKSSNFPMRRNSSKEQASFLQPTWLHSIHSVSRWPSWSRRTPSTYTRFTRRSSLISSRQSPRTSAFSSRISANLKSQA